MFIWIRLMRNTSTSSIQTRVDSGLQTKKAMLTSYQMVAPRNQAVWMTPQVRVREFQISLFSWTECGVCSVAPGYGHHVRQSLLTSSTSIWGRDLAGPCHHKGRGHCNQPVGMTPRVCSGEFQISLFSWTECGVCSECHNNGRSRWKRALFASFPSYTCSCVIEMDLRMKNKIDTSVGSWSWILEQLGPNTESPTKKRL